MGPKITEALEKALELDRTLAELQYMLANDHFLVTWNWEASESAYKKVIEINPNHPEAQALYAQLLIVLGRSEEAYEHAELSLKLDPHNPWIIIWYSAGLLFENRYDEAFEALKLAMSIRYKDFDHVFDQYVKLGYVDTLNLEADTLPEQSKTKYLSQIDIAFVYSLTANKEGALDCLEQACEMHDPAAPYIGVFPNFDFYTMNPAFRKSCEN